MIVGFPEIVESLGATGGGSGSGTSPLAMGGGGARERIRNNLNQTKRTDVIKLTRLAFCWIPCWNRLSLFEPITH